MTKSNQFKLNVINFLYNDFLYYGGEHLLTKSFKVINRYKKFQIYELTVIEIIESWEIDNNTTIKEWTTEERTIEFVRASNNNDYLNWERGYNLNRSSNNGVALHNYIITSENGKGCIK